MFKKFTLAAAALVMFVGSAMADDISGLDLASIKDADNVVVEANLNVDVDALTSQTTDKVDQAVEACFRGFGGGWGGYGYGYSSCYYPSYSYCYYPSYSYCYPTYFSYRPVCYSYAPVCYSLYSWGCY